MKKFIQEFKEFAFKGNIIDMAVGVVIGAAFGKIVTALVENIISPLIALATGSATLSAFAITLKEATLEDGSDAVLLNIGAFLQAIIDFLIIALTIFIVLKLIMKAKTKFEEMKKKEEEAPAEEAAPEETELSVLKEIKDLLTKDAAEK